MAENCGISWAGGPKSKRTAEVISRPKRARRPGSALDFHRPRSCSIYPCIHLFKKTINSIQRPLGLMHSRIIATVNYVSTPVQSFVGFCDRFIAHELGNTSLLKPGQSALHPLKMLFHLGSLALDRVGFDRGQRFAWYGQPCPGFLRP